MPPVVKAGDKVELVPTKLYPHAQFPFEFFNPLQSRVFDYYDKDNSCIIAAATSAGKTIAAELFLAEEVRKRGGKGLYLAPLCALTQEKLDDWSDPSHHFHDLKVSACTGDYRLTAKRRKELEQANLIVMTSELLNHLSRNNQSEKSQFLLDVGTIVTDESHLLTVPGRGDHLEAGLMKFSEINPKARHIFLSATMPNVEEIADWVSYILTHRDTCLISSTYRPCPLNVHYEKYWDGERSYEDNELQKVNLAMQIIDYYPDDKFLVFVHTKKTGELMKLALQRAKIKCEFHNADLIKEKRIALEKEFKSSKDLRVVVATSTLAWGTNMPARRVIVLGVHRGMGEVATYDIAQMCVAADSRIMLYGQSELFKKASEVKIGDVVAGIEDNCLVGGLVKHIYVKKANLKTIEFSNGTHIEVSNHPVLTWNGEWKSSDSLVVGDKVCITTCSAVNGICLKDLCLSKIDSFFSYCRLSDDEFACVMKGSRTKLASVLEVIPKTITQMRQRRRNVVKTAIAKKLGFEPHWFRSKNGSELDLNKLDYANFPWLLGILASDGCVTCNKTHTRIRLIMNSYLIVRKFRNILQRSGLHPSFGKDKRGRWVCECNNYVLTKLVVALGITPKKTRTLDLSGLLGLDSISLKGFLAGIIDGDGHVSNKAVRICTASKLAAFQLKEMFLRIGMHSQVRQYSGSGRVFQYMCDTTHYVVTCSKWNKLSGYGFKLKSKKICRDTRHLKGDLFYTKVESIKEIGQKQVYNFSISRCETFVVEDIVTHNCGRAGRPSYDPVGDAYVLLPEKTFDMHKARLKKPQRIESQMLDQMGGRHKVLAFHLVSEIHQGNIQNRDDVHHWYKRSLACFQANELNEQVVDDTVELLRKIGAIWEEEGKLTVTSVGKVASIFYYSPFDVADMKRNFTQLFDSGRHEDDYCLSFALGNIDTLRCGIVSKAEREEMAQYAAKINFLFPEGYIVEPAIKAGYAYHTLLSGHPNPVLAGYSRGLQFDFPRTNQVLQAIDSFTGKWGKKGWLTHLMLRMAYGVKGPQAYLCQLPYVGKVRANKLYHSGIKTIKDVAENPNLARSLLGLKEEMMTEIISEAERLASLKSADLT